MLDNIQEVKSEKEFGGSNDHIVDSVDIEFRRKYLDIPVEECDQIPSIESIQYP